MSVGPALANDTKCAELVGKLAYRSGDQILGENGADSICFPRVHNESLVFDIVAHGDGTTHPYAFALGGRHLVPDALGCHFALELCKGQKNVQG